MAPEGPLPPRRTLALLALAVAVLCAFTFAPMLGWGFTDADAWADVAWARHPLGDQLLSRLTGGVAGKDANFWRPAVMLQFWVERRCFGWNAVGWQAWDLAEHALATWLGAVFVAATARFAGVPWRAAMWATAILFAIHPLTEDVVPAVARSIDLLLAVGMYGTMVALVLAQSGRRWAWGGVVLGATVALGAKESAVLLLPAVASWVLLFRADLGLRPRFVLAALATAPVAILTVAWLAVRAHVLVGVGGYTEEFKSAGGSQALARSVVENFATALANRLPEGWPTLVPLGGLVAAALFAGWRSPHRKLVVLGFGWFTLACLLHAITGTVSRRVFYAPTLPALLMVVPALLHARRHPVGLLLGGAWLAVFAYGSPAFLRYHQWPELSAASDRYRNVDFWAKLPKGTRVWLAERPFRTDLDRRTFRWRDAGSLHHGATAYSVQAWLDEVLPEKSLHVETLTGTVLTTPLERQSVTVALDGDTLRVDHPGAVRQDWEIRSPFTTTSVGTALVVVPKTTRATAMVVVWTSEGPVAWRPETGELIR